VQRLLGHRDLVVGQAEDRASRTVQLPDHATVPEEERCGVPGVDVAQHSGRQVQTRDGSGDESLGGCLVGQVPVGGADGVDQVKPLAPAVPQGGQCHRGEDRPAQVVPRSVEDGQVGDVVHDAVVEGVRRHLVARFEDPGDDEPFAGEAERLQQVPQELAGNRASAAACGSGQRVAVGVLGGDDVSDEEDERPVGLLDRAVPHVGAVRHRDLDDAQAVDPVQQGHPQARAVACDGAGSTRAKARPARVPAISRACRRRDPPVPTCTSRRCS